MKQRSSQTDDHPLVYLIHGISFVILVVMSSVAGAAHLRYLAIIAPLAWLVATFISVRLRPVYRAEAFDDYLIVRGPRVVIRLPWRAVKEVSGGGPVFQVRIRGHEPLSLDFEGSVTIDRLASLSRDGWAHVAPPIADSERALLKLAELRIRTRRAAGPALGWVLCWLFLVSVLWYPGHFGAQHHVVLGVVRSICVAWPAAAIALVLYARAVSKAAVRVSGDDVLVTDDSGTVRATVRRRGSTLPRFLTPMLPRGYRLSLLRDGYGATSSGPYRDSIRARPPALVLEAEAEQAAPTVPGRRGLFERGL